MENEKGKNVLKIEKSKAEQLMSKISEVEGSIARLKE